MKTEAEAGRAVAKHADAVRRICFLHLKNYHDVEDVFQTVFLRYILCPEAFESDAHERAWLIRVAINCCKDVFKSFYRRMVVSFEDVETEPLYIEQSREVLDAIMQLPIKYRDVIYLSYYEGYTGAEIAKILGRNENTIYTWLSRAKSVLRESLGGDALER